MASQREISVDKSRRSGDNHTHARGIPNSLGRHTAIDRVFEEDLARVASLAFYDPNFAFAPDIAIGVTRLRRNCLFASLFYVNM